MISWDDFDSATSGGLWCVVLMIVVGGGGDSV